MRKPPSAKRTRRSSVPRKGVATHDVPVRAVAGSDNVFRDLGIRDADLHRIKADHAIGVKEALRQREMTQAEGAGAAEIAASDMSDICRGKLTKFSLERLQSVLLALGVDIEIRLTHRAPTAGAGRRAVTTSA